MTELAALDELWNLPRPDSVIGRRYRIGELLGEGGMSAVFLARDERLGRKVAFKVLSPKLAYSREVVTRFVNEARTLASLDCPHIVRVFDAGVTSEPDSASLPYMVLELLRGDDLRTHCERGPVSPARAVAWVLQACEGLSAAHAEGVIHRDLKPENLFVSLEADGTELVKLLDFGVARSLVAPATLTLSGEGVGSPGYMSPEQLRDASAADERSDIWSLGVVLYELLAGVPPFQAPSAFELCAKILAGGPTPLSQLRPNLPRGLSGIVQQCLSVDPATRFHDVADLADALATYAENGAAAVQRIRRRLHPRRHSPVRVDVMTIDAAAATQPVISDAPPSVQPATAFDEQLDAEPSPPADVVVLARRRSRGRARQILARTAAALSVAAMLALLAQAYKPYGWSAGALVERASTLLSEHDLVHLPVGAP